MAVSQLLDCAVLPCACVQCKPAAGILYGPTCLNQAPSAAPGLLSAAEVAAPKARKPLFGGFGTRKISQPAPVVEEEEEEEEPAPAPAPKKKAAGGFFTLSSKKQPAAKQAEEVEEEEEAAPAPKKAFAFSSSRRQPAPEAAEDAAPAPAPAPEQPKRIIRGRKPLAAPVEEKPRPAPAQPAPAAQENGAPKKSGGFLGFLGISSETVYADEQ